MLPSLFSSTFFRRSPLDFGGRSNVVSQALGSLSATIPSRSGPSLTHVRFATHMSEGRANGAKDGAGKRLGPKNGDGMSNTFVSFIVLMQLVFRVFLSLILLSPFRSHLCNADKVFSR